MKRGWSLHYVILKSSGEIKHKTENAIDKKRTQTQLYVTIVAM